MNNDSRYLINRHGNWHYHRRVPVAFAKFDARKFIRRSLKTASRAIARERRDAMEAADNTYWAAIIGIYDEHNESPEARKLRVLIESRYETDQLRAITLGLSTATKETTLRDLALGRLLDFFQANGVGTEGELHASNKVVAVTVSEAFEIYREQIAIDQLVYKSPSQRRDWVRARKTSIRRFVDIVGDRPIGLISREDALEFYKWWVDRLKPRLGRPQRAPNTANRDFGTLRRLYSEYFAFYGEEGRSNPFRNLSFGFKNGEGPLPYRDDFVRNRILAPGALDNLLEPARLLILTLIETGCRTSEIANIRAQDIILDTDVPYIRIQPRPGREVKAPSSMREIPLVGVALEALTRAPEGFPKYRNREAYLSAYLNRKLDEADLRPTQRHSVYSLRHAFERRMLEAEIDFELRCRLMGHKVGRPLYGGGGSMAFRRDQLLKIAHPYSDRLFSGRE